MGHLCLVSLSEPSTATTQVAELQERLSEMSDLMQRLMGSGDDDSVNGAALYRQCVAVRLASSSATNDKKQQADSSAESRPRSALRKNQVRLLVHDIMAPFRTVGRWMNTTLERIPLVGSTSLCYVTLCALRHTAISCTLALNHENPPAKFATDQA